MNNRRTLEVVVLSDMHLGTFGCRSKELTQYLRSIHPKTLILNGDIIDIWQFNKRLWSRSHTTVIKEIISLLSTGTRVFYITGNHDEMIRRYTGFKTDTFAIVNKLVWTLSNGQKAWIFHGDVFDIMMEHSKWLTRMGAVGYDILIYINSFANTVSKWLGKGHISFSAKVKDKVKSAVKYINKFENIVAETGAKNNFDYVICGHIHKPEISKMSTENGEITYLNSGDWIENLTALEFDGKDWDVYHYKDNPDMHEASTEMTVFPSYQEIFASLKKEIITF